MQKSEDGCVPTTPDPANMLGMTDLCFENSDSLSKGAKRLAATVPFFLPGFAQRRCPFWRWCFCVDLLQHLPVLCQKSIQRQGHKTAFGGGECSRFFLDLLQHLHVLCQTRASKDKDTLQPGGNACDFFLD